MPDQSLDNIVSVSVVVSPTLAAAPDFNVGLIVGTSTIISAADRVKLYASLEEMKTDGFTGAEPEYLAATVYFAQTPKPANVAIGRQDLTATPAETPVQAVTACRQASGDWYACGFATTGGITDAEAADVAAYIEAAETPSVYFYRSKDANVLSATTPNIMDTMKAANYRRSFGIWSTADNAEFAPTGYAMGANTGIANSSYTLAYKTLSGISPDEFTTTQLNNVLGYNGNAYTGYGGRYDLLVQGTVSDGTHFDEVINLDVLTADIQISAMNVLVGSPKIPQTEDGVSMIVQAITTACNDAVTRGAIAPGVWNAPAVLALQTGDSLPNGFLIQAESIASQSQTDREARKSPPIYVAVKMAGAIEHVVISVIVNR